MKKTSVLAIIPGFARDPGGCEIYRVTQPLWWLGQQNGWDTGWTWWDDFWARYVYGGMDAWAELVLRFDVVVWPRFFVPEDPKVQDGVDALFTLLERFGKHIVYETDDDYTNEHRQVVDGDAMWVAKRADAITVTTPYLASTVGKRTKVPTYVLPNCVDPTVWKDNPAPARTSMSEGKIVIGLTGSPTHEQDWKVLAPVMKPFLEANPNTMLILGGFHPDYLDDCHNTVRLPGLTYLRYSQIIKGCDIILCPVDKQDGFNLGKSPIKLVEGQAAARPLENGQLAGAAVIATNNEIYSLAATHGKTALLVDQTPEAWRDALQSLVDRRDLRTELQIKGFNSVYKRYDISREWTQWAQAYRKITSKKKTLHPSAKEALALLHSA